MTTSTSRNNAVPRRPCRSLVNVVSLVQPRSGMPGGRSSEGMGRHSTSGRTPSRRVTLRATRSADPREAAALHLAEGAAVHVIEGVSLIDDQPVAVFRSVFDALRFSALLDHMAEQNSVTAALAACGLTDYTRAETRLTAKAAPATLALTLGYRTRKKNKNSDKYIVRGRRRGKGRSR